MSDKKFVSIGIVITIQYQAHLVGSPYENIYSAALHANMELANEYKEKRYRENNTRRVPWRKKCQRLKVIIH